MELPSSKDVEDERLKLQQDIKKIQDTLYDDSYSDYDSDSDSECLEIDLDRRNQTDDDGQTRSSVGESSTSHLGGTEVSDATDFDRELFVGDANTTELPITTESSLALNRAYQEVIVDILHQIEESLEENRRRQEDAERDLIGQREKNLTNAQYKVYYRQYCMPYIKDPNGGIPPPNEDVLLKKMLKEHKQDIMPERDWLVRDRKRMYDAIAEDSLQQLLQPLMIKLELEQEKLEKCDKADEVAIAARIGILEDEIANKRLTSRADLLRKVDVQKTDWLKISNIAYDGRKSWQECQMMWMNVLNPSVNRGKWDANEDNQLVSYVNMYNGKNWVKIAELLNTGRTAFQCLQRYQVYLNPENLNRPWTAAEDKKILQIVRNIRNTGHRLVWGKVSSYMENRSANMCFSRFHQIDPDMKRGAWDKEEDLNLYTAVQMVGMNSWTKIAEFVPGRNSLQCRDRWTNSLDPSIRMGNWTYEEDKALLLAAQELGTKSWTKLATRLPGRTDNQVLQRYKRLENWERKMKWFEELPEVTRRALLGCHLSPEEMKEREHMTWESFKKELCIDRDDYKKQERDRAKGDIVVPRPPPLTGFTTLVPKRTIDSRIQLQNIILKHVRSIQGHSDQPIPDLHGSEVHQDLAVKVQFADANNVSVKKLLELSRHMKRSLAIPDKQSIPQVHKVKRSPKKSYNVVAAVRIKRKLEEMLRLSVQSIFKTKRKMKKGRPRKFFSRSLTGNYSEEEIHNIKVKSLNLIMKALDVDARKMLHNATMVKEKKSTSSQSAPSTSSAPKPNTTPCSKKSRTTTKRQKKETQKEVADNGSEDEEIGDVGMLKSVSQKEAEGSQAGQEDHEEIEGIVMGMDSTKHGGSTVAGSGRKTTIQESPRGEQSASSLTKQTLLRTPQKKSVTFVLNDNDSKKIVTLSNPNKVTRIVVKSFVKQPASQSEGSSTSASTIVTPASTSTLSVIKPTSASTSVVMAKATASTSTITKAISASTSTVTPAKAETYKSVSASTVVTPTSTSTLTVIKPTSASTSAVMAKATTSTSTISTAISTSTSTVTPAKAVTYKSVSTQVLAISDSESSDESDYENEKSLPLLPPNATNMRAFKSLLLNRKKNMSIAGSLYDPKFYHLPPSKYKSKPAQVAMDAASVNRKRGREASEPDAQPAKKVATSGTETGDTMTSLSREGLREIHRTDEYQLLKARFQSIFVWPALMSAIHPPFDRKEFCQKANFVTAGEEEVAHVERIRTKGYPLNRTHKFYQKQVRLRSKKAEMQKKKRGLPTSDEQANKDGSDNTDLVTDVTAEDDTQDATPSEPPVKRRGRPRGKTKPHAIVMCGRSMRERKEKVVPEKPPAEKPRRLRVAKKRAVLNNDLRKSMLESVAAMKEGLIPDPAKNIHVSEPPRPTGLILQSNPIQNNLVCETPESGMTNKYTIVLPTQLKPSKIKTSPSAKMSSSVSGKKHAEENPQTSEVNSQSTSDIATPLKPAAPASAFVPVATTTSTTGTADTVSVPMANCTSGIPMMLSYVAGVDGSVVPVLNPLPVKLLQNICSTTVSVPQVKVEENEIETASMTQSQESGSLPATQSVESVNAPATSESVGSVSVSTTQETKMSVSVPTISVMETSVSKSSKES